MNYRRGARPSYSVLGAGILTILLCQNLGASDSIFYLPEPNDMGLPHPSYPYAAVAEGLGGTVVMAITFGPDGSVTKCDVIQSSGVEILDSYTVTFIKKNWRAIQFAGKTLKVPIAYDPGSRRKYSNKLASLPNFLPPGSPPKSLTVRVAFGADGSVAGAEIVKSSGLEEVDKKTVNFIKRQWQQTDYANKSLLFPIQYQTPGEGLKARSIGPSPNRRDDYARPKYLPSVVLILTNSPSLMKSGTWI